MQRAEAIVQPFVDSGEITNVFATRARVRRRRLHVRDARAMGRAHPHAAGDHRRSQPPSPGDSRHPDHAFTANSLGIRGGGQGLQFAVTGPDYDQIAVAATDLMRAMQDDPTYDTVRLNYDTTQPQLSIRIDRDRAADVGVPVQNISAVIQTLLEGRDLGTFTVGDERIEIRAMAPDGMIQDPAGLDRIQLRTGSGKMVPLSSLVSFEEVAVAPNLQRQDQRRAVPMSATLGPETDLREAMDRVQEIAANVLPPGMGIVFTGEAKELDQASSGVVQTFAFALLVVLLVLAAQFESFISAIILIATVPFGLAAAVFAMLLTGGSLNIYSQIGLIMLVGLMAKNGILIVEFANQLRDQGQSVRDAIRNASIIRLRPVVMTMIATVLGGLPLILTGGAGSEARQALGWIVVGGLGIATFATLFVTPVVFSLLARFSRPRAAEEQRLERELDEADGPRGMTPTAEELGEVAPAPVPAE